MPHKRNPMLCEAIRALARLCFNQACGALDGLMLSEVVMFAPFGKS